MPHLGYSDASVIVGWQVYEITKNPFSLGLIGLFEGIPFLVVSLFSGHVAYTVNRKKIIILSAAVLFISSAILWVLVTGWFNPHPGNIIVIIYQLIFIIGIARGFIGRRFLLSCRR
jgi:hypothetical protein